MRKLTEIEEMAIFDLLEGNLSANEASHWQQKIKEDQALAHEYKLMQLTYLNHADEKVKVPAALWQAINKPAKAKVLAWPMWSKAAAVLILLGVAAYFINHNLQEKPSQKLAKIAEQADTQPVKNILIKPQAQVHVLPSTKGTVALEPMPKPSGNSSHKTTLAHFTTVSAQNTATTAALTSPNAQEQITSATASTQNSTAAIVENTQPITAIQTAPTTLIILEPQTTATTTALAPQQPKQSWLQRAKNELRRGKTPDVEVHFNPKTFKFQFAINN